VKFLFALALLILPAWGEFEVPELSGPVVDQAGLLDARTTSALEGALQAIKAKGGPQINVLTVDSIDPYTIEEASIRVAKTWALGTGEKDNGVLLIVAKKERKVRIEVGQGLEGSLTDAYSRRIIDNDIIPAFRHGDSAAGIVGGVRGILLRMEPPLNLEDYIGQSYVSQRPRTKMGGSKIIFLIILFLVIFLISSQGGMGGGRGMRGGPYIGGGGFGGGSFGGGGWSGGGGGFSGGGSSGSW
jgi:uncharacterized protein